MNINVGQALTPWAGDPEGAKKAAIFTAVIVVCVFTSVLIIPGLLLPLYMGGYLVSYLRNVSTGDNDSRLPSPTSPESLWHGLVCFFVYILYCLPLMGVMFLGLGGMVAGLASGAKMNSAAAAMGGMASAGIAGMIAILLTLVICCFAPMIFLQYCKRYQFADAFDFASIFSGMLRSPVDYLVVLLVPFGLSLVAAMLPFLYIFLVPVISLIAANLAGQYGHKVLGMGGDSVSNGDNVGFNRF